MQKLDNTITPDTYNIIGIYAYMCTVYIKFLDSINGLNLKGHQTSIVLSYIWEEDDEVCTSW